MSCRLTIMKSTNKSSSSSFKDKCRDQFSKTINNLKSKRSIIEKAREARIERIHNDLKDIVKRENEYSKELIEQVAPVKVVWNESFIEALASFAPFRLEKVEDGKFNVNTGYDGDIEDNDEKTTILSTIDYTLDDSV